MSMPVATDALFPLVDVNHEGTSRPRVQLTTSDRRASPMLAQSNGLRIVHLEQRRPNGAIVNHGHVGHPARSQVNHQKCNP